jgi:hypothetical protein
VDFHRFFPALTFAHLARAAAAIRARPAAEMRRFGALLGPSLEMPFCFAQRAFCAARIFARPLALNFRLPDGLAPSLPPYTPAKAASAAFSPVNRRANLSRSVFNSAIMFGMVPLGTEFYHRELSCTEPALPNLHLYMVGEVTIRKMQCYTTCVHQTRCFMDRAASFEEANPRPGVDRPCVRRLIQALRVRDSHVRSRAFRPRQVFGIEESSPGSPFSKLAWEL